MLISRKKFLILSISSIALVIYPNLNKIKTVYSYNKFLKKNINNQIIKFNNSREYELNNNLKLEIKKDYEEGRTIWLEKNIYTYAELYQLEN